MANKKWAVGVDIGGTKIAIAHVDSAGEIQNSFIFNTNVSGGTTGVVNEIISAIQKITHEVSTSPSGIGIGMAGQIEAETGLVYFAPNLKWHNFPLQKTLSEALNLPVAVINDVRAATWGEWKHGAGRKCNDLVCMFVGTGIGGGIVSKGELLLGTSNTAGEVGHMTIDLNGPICTCGGKGCLEARASGWAIAKYAKDAVASNPTLGEFILNSVNYERNEINAHTVVQAFYAGDPLAKKLIDQVTEALIAGVVTIVNTLNPSRIILGGGIIEGLPELVDWIQDGVERRALTAATKSLQIVHTQLQGNAGVIGAATYILQK